MGVKRTQDSGRRDALGREIKVSGNAGERASEGGVDGGESGVRVDFATEESVSSPIADVNEIFDDLEKIKAMRTETDQVNRDLYRGISISPDEDFFAKTRPLDEQRDSNLRDLDQRVSDVLATHVSSLAEHLDSHGVEQSVDDPHFGPAYWVVDNLKENLDKETYAEFSEVSEAVEAYHAEHR